jgi:ABC-2 type transport system ATP-binding protein
MVLQAGRPVLDDVTFEVPRGSTVALLGPPGAGKTTVIEVGLALRNIDGGVVRVLGFEPEIAVASGRVGVVLSSSGLPSGARVSELLHLVRVLHDAPLPVDDLIDRAGLASLLDCMTDRLTRSQGQQLRFALALAGERVAVLLLVPAAGHDGQARGVLHLVRRRARQSRYRQECQV